MTRGGIAQLETGRRFLGNRARPGRRSPLFLRRLHQAGEAASGKAGAAAGKEGKSQKVTRLK
jgi:hypothetical protein